MWFITVYRRHFSSKLVLICQTSEYWTTSTKQYCAAMHAGAALDKNIEILRKFPVLLISKCVPPLDPACPFAKKYVFDIHTTYPKGILGQGVGTRSAKRKCV